MGQNNLEGISLSVELNAVFEIISLKKGPMQYES